MSKHSKEDLPNGVRMDWRAARMKLTLAIIQRYGTDVARPAHAEAPDRLTVGNIQARLAYERLLIPSKSLLLGALQFRIGNRLTTLSGGPW